MTASLVSDVVDAHGTYDAWREHPAVQLRFSAVGLAFASKGQRRALEDVRATVATTGQHVRLELGRWPGWNMQLQDDGMHLSNPAGQTWIRRGPRTWALCWDVADVAWFCAQAIWTYAALPFVLADDTVTTVRPLPGRRLAVTFAPGIHTHCRMQTLHVDPQLRIVRHDYTAEAFGRWARATQTVAAHRRFGRLLVPTERVVHPRRCDGTPRRGPTLVRIRVADVTPVARVDAAAPPAMGGQCSPSAWMSAVSPSRTGCRQLDEGDCDFSTHCAHPPNGQYRSDRGRLVDLRTGRDRHACAGRIDSVSLIRPWSGQSWQRRAWQPDPSSGRTLSGDVELSRRSAPPPPRPSRPCRSPRADGGMHRRERGRSPFRRPRALTSTLIDSNFSCLPSPT